MPINSKGSSLNILMSQLIKSGVPGLSLALADRQGLIATAVAGEADITASLPVKTDHLFGIGSITKTFVAVIILQLIEEGRLQLTQSPASILGDALLDIVPTADGVTLAQLLNHTSGIPSWEDDPRWIKEGRGEDLDLQRLWQAEDSLPYITNTGALHLPGTTYAYANTHHTLLGLIIEKVTGRDAVLEIQLRILQPLGLTDIYLEGFQPLPTRRLARRYHYATTEFKARAGINPGFKAISPDLIDVSRSNLSVEWLAGGMVATASDLVLFAAALRGGRLLKPDSMALMQQWFPVDSNTEVGQGVFRQKIQQNTDSATYLIGHNGAVLGYTATMYWLEKEDLSMVVLANVGTMHAGPKLAAAGRLAMDPKFIQAAVNVANKKRKATYA
jgi:D-alanyl-D-alanine carboxypeptidase